MVSASYVDSHFHFLEMRRKNPGALQILRSAFSTGLAGAMDAGVDEEDMEARLGLQKELPGILTAFGYSPRWVTEQNWEERAEIGLSQWAGDSRISAIGEAGLDFYWNYGKPGEQERLFRMQIDVACGRKKPLIIHTRNADSRTHEILLPFREKISGVLHCFCSDVGFAEKMLDIGLFISFAGNITYKKSESIREAAITVPLDRILLETDSPYLSPQPFRGRDNSPANMGVIHEFVAKLKGIPVQRLAEQVRQNFRELFQR